MLLKLMPFWLCNQSTDTNNYVSISSHSPTPLPSQSLCSVLLSYDDCYLTYTSESTMNTTMSRNERHYATGCSALAAGL